ncbi:MAG: allantoicase [Actinomycetales bacterium]
MSCDEPRADVTEPTSLPFDEDGLPMVELSSRHLAAGVVAASDESFGNKEHLLTPDPADFSPGTYDHRGEVVDGWETRRRRGRPGHDWVIVRLGIPGVIRRVDVDTSFFTGNYPEQCWVDACGLEGYPGPEELAAAQWERIADVRPLKGDTHNLMEVTSPLRFTHLRLSVAPDGGVARLRVHGRPVIDPRHLDGVTADLASQQLGARVIRSSDNFYGSASVLTRPDRARTMGEGWETRRRRDDGNDWAVIQLAAAGRLRQLEVDTAHFKHNASSDVEVRAGAMTRPADATATEVADGRWTSVLERTALQPDTRHVFVVEPPADEAVASYVRVDAFPDGGLSRVRVLGEVVPDARLELGLDWFNTLPLAQGHDVLRRVGLDHDTAEAVVERRPFSTLEDALGLLVGRPSDGRTQLSRLLRGPLS